MYDSHNMIHNEIYIYARPLLFNQGFSQCSHIQMPTYNDTFIAQNLKKSTLSTLSAFRQPMHIGPKAEEINIINFIGFLATYAHGSKS